MLCSQRARGSALVGESRRDEEEAEGQLQRCCHHGMVARHAPQEMAGTTAGMWGNQRATDDVRHASVSCVSRRGKMPRPQQICHWIDWA